MRASIALLLVFAAPAAAQWPTTDWEVMDSPGGDLTAIPWLGGDLDAIAARIIPPVGERARFARQHEGMLEGGSAWFQSLRFAPPLQITEDYDRAVSAGEAYLAILKRNSTEIGSSHGAEGMMNLTTHPRFLDADTPIWDLMEASAIHELYHGVQKGSSASLVSRMVSEPPELAGCPGDTDLDWLVEGTAAMVQIRWLEGQKGPWGHPFHGSSRASWVREFDQPLVRGSLPGEQLASQPPRPEMTEMETISWACDYGTWYFWYAVGEMIGRTPEERVAFTRYIFEGTEPWADGGVANADAGLKAAAAEYRAITPYREGLYDLYPEFVAQYLTADRFYRSLETVEMEAPGLYEATAAASGGALGPLANRAWRVRVRLPQNASPIPYNVRFTLEASGSTDRDDLHLIVGDDVAGRPAEASTPYTAVRRTDAVEPADDGAIEFLVRVANVAPEATDTEDAEFTLRVEVDGFYGSDADATAAQVGGELPPGFAVNGPGFWGCRGGSDARAVFDLMTPDELGQDIDRMVPEMAQDMEDQMDDLEIMIQRLEAQGQSAGMSREQIQQMREQMRAEIARATAEAQPDINEAAQEARGRRMTTLGATFVGREGGDECQVTLLANLRGREGGAQMIPGAAEPDHYPEDERPEFGLMVYPGDALRAMRTGYGATGPAGAPDMRAMQQLAERYGNWEVCTMTDEDRRRERESVQGTGCPAVTCTAGQLVLERAEQGRVAGTFQFEVVRWPDEQTGRCRRPEARGTVSGHFNVASTDDGTDDNSLSGLGGVMSGAVPIIPGAPILFTDVDD